MTTKEGPTVTSPAIGNETNFSREEAVWKETLEPKHGLLQRRQPKKTDSNPWQKRNGAVVFKYV